MLIDWLLLVLYVLIVGALGFIPAVIAERKGSEKFVLWLAVRRRAVDRRAAVRPGETIGGELKAAGL